MILAITRTERLESTMATPLNYTMVQSVRNWSSTRDKEGTHLSTLLSSSNMQSFQSATGGGGGGLDVVGVGVCVVVWVWVWICGVVVWVWICGVVVWVWICGVVVWVVVWLCDRMVVCGCLGRQFLVDPCSKLEHWLQKWRTAPPLS